MSKWGFKKSTKHVYFTQNFLHMCLTSKLKMFEPNAHLKKTTQMIL